MQDHGAWYKYLTIPTITVVTGLEVNDRTEAMAFNIFSNGLGVPQNDMATLAFKVTFLKRYHHINFIFLAL